MWYVRRFFCFIRIFSIFRNNNIKVWKIWLWYKGNIIKRSFLEVDFIDNGEDDDNMTMDIDEKEEDEENKDNKENKNELKEVENKEEIN